MLQKLTAFWRNLNLDEKCKFSSVLVFLVILGFALGKL